MKNFFSKITSRGGVFRWILALEAVFLILFGAFLITRPENSFTYLAEDLVEDKSELVDGAIELSKDNPRINDVHFYLHLGGYETKVDYEIIPGDASDEETEEAEEVEEVGGLSFASAKIQGPMPDAGLRLTDLSTSETGRLYSNFGQPLVMWLSYGGSGKMKVYNIQIEEVVWFRAVLFAIALLGLVVIDLIYLFFKTKEISPKTKKAAAAIAGISLIASVAFTTNMLPSGLDTDFHYTRIATLSEEIKNGNFPVRMMTSMLNDHSYPNPIFYCDIFLYIPALLYLAFVPLRICFQIYCIVFTALTCLIAYLCLNKITKNTKASLIGASIYALSSYRLTVVLVRAAVGEFSAMAFLPLIILGLYQIYTKEKPRFLDWAPLGIGVASVLMCHIISTELVLLFIAIFCLIKSRKTFTKERFLSLIKAALLCLGLTAWFLVPLADYMLKQPVKVSGDGGSRFYSGAAVNLVEQLNPSTSINDFPTVGLAIILCICLAVWFLIANRKNKQIKKPVYNSILYLTIIGGLALLLSSVFFPWDLIMQLSPRAIFLTISTIQFPYRFDTIAAVALNFSAALIFANLKNTTLASYQKAISIALVSISIVSGLHFSYSSLYDQETVFVPYSTTEDTMVVGSGEYLPAYNDLKLISDARKSEVKAKDNVEFSYEKIGDEYRLTYNNKNDEASEISLPIYAYRYFTAKDEAGNVVKTTISEDQLITISLPAKTEGKITVKFIPPTFWHLAEIVSLGTLVICIFWFRRERQV